MKMMMSKSLALGLVIFFVGTIGYLVLIPLSRSAPN
jgi:preprotein translocase subunit Sss1